MEDNRIRYTKRVIKEKFLELLDEKPINKITVTELCSKCEINRATFYRHYDDVYDLMNKLEMQFTAELKDAITVSKDDYTISGFTEEILEVILKNKDLSRILFSKRTGKEFLHDILVIAHNKCLEKWKQSNKEVTENQVHYLCTFISNGTIGVLEEWIQKDYQDPANEIADLIENISYFGLNKIIY